MPSKKSKGTIVKGMTSSGKDLPIKKSEDMTVTAVAGVEANNISTPEITVAPVIVPVANTPTSPSPLTVGETTDSPWRDIPDVVTASRHDSIPPMTPPSRSPVVEKEEVMNPMAAAAIASKTDSTSQVVNSLVHPELGEVETTMNDSFSTPITKPMMASTPSLTTPTHGPMAGGGPGPGPSSPSIPLPPKIPPPPMTPLRNGKEGVVVKPPASPTRIASSKSTKKTTTKTTDTDCDCCPQPYKKLELTTLAPLSRPPPPPPPKHAPPSKSNDIPPVPAAGNPTVRPTWMT